MTLTPQRPAGVVHLWGSAGVRGLESRRRLKGHTDGCTQWCKLFKHTHTCGWEVSTRQTDVVSKFQLLRTWLLRLDADTLAYWYSLICTLTVSSICDSPDLCCCKTSACVCVFVCGCVYHLEECTVFGNVKSSPQWSQEVQTHSVLLDGP